MVVAISNPPKKSDDTSGEFSKPQSEIRSLGGTQQKDFGPRGKGRSQVGFMPRSLAVAGSSSANMKLQPMKFVQPAAAAATATSQPHQASAEKSGASDDGGSKDETTPPAGDPNPNGNSATSSNAAAKSN